MIRRALACVLLSACAASPALSAARRGDNVALREAIRQKHTAGKLSDSEASDIAHAVLQHDLTASPTLDRISNVRLCAKDVKSELEDLAKKHDATGAEAAMALYDADEMSAGSARDYVSDPDDGWRAVGVRALVRSGDGVARRNALVDPSGRVRRAAMHACGEAHDDADVDALLEAARVDPDPLTRNDAVRAITRIDPKGHDIANRFRDLWNVGDDPLREDIALAFAAPNIAAGGGAEALRVIVASAHGAGVVSGSAAILRSKPGTFDDETRKSATGALVRAIDAGARQERLLAMALGPTSDADVLAALQRSTKCDDDMDVQLMAWVRLLDVPKQRDQAVKELELFATPNDKSTRGSRARLALAAASDTHIQAWIEMDLLSSDAHVRSSAAQGLVALGRAARAAPLLADDDVTVRMRTACVILARPRV